MWLDARLTPLLGALAGLVLAALAWLVIGVHLSEPPRLAALEAAARSVTRPAPTAPVQRLAGAAADQHLLFATSTGPGAVSEVSLQLLGVAKGPRDQAALISIDKSPARWLSLGQTVDGVTLVDIESAKVLLDTVLGFREVALDSASSPLEDAGASGSLPQGRRP